MKYLIALFLSLSIFAVEEIPQAVSTPSNAPLVFALFSANHNKGTYSDPSIGGYYKIQTAWSGAQQVGGVLRNFSHDGILVNSASLPLTAGAFQNAFTTWNQRQDDSDIGGQILETAFFRADVVTPPAHGTLAFTASFNSADPAPFSGPQLTYTPVTDYVGSDEFLITYRTFGGSDRTIIRVTVTISNTLPVVSASASPSVTIPNQSVLFTAVATDANNHALSYSWDFGDGSPVATSPDAPHAYAASGIYTATLTVSDGFGSVSKSVTIDVAGANRVPRADFLTSTLLGVVGQRLTFDASPSTDPQNAIVSYTWDFGDGSPAGAGGILSKSYAAVGSYLVTLTIFDAEGLRATVTRSIEVVTEQEAIETEGEVSFTAKLQLSRVERDTLSITARLPFDGALAEGSVVAVAIASQRVEGTLSKRLKGSGFTIKAKVRSLPTGTIELRYKGRGLTLGAGLTALGAADEAAITVPITIEVGGKTFVVPVGAECEFNATGTKGTISGSL